MIKESDFQYKLIQDLKMIFPGCIILKNDPNYIQGIPDLILLYENNWASLEVKRSKTASQRPNQEYYVDMMNDMSYSNFVYPENKEDVLNDIQSAFRLKR